MKRILAMVFCVALLLNLAHAEETYYHINPNGGQFYHAQPDCPTISEQYWEKLASYTMSELLTSPYHDLEPCPFCLKLERSEVAYFVNPDGGQFYHDDWHCPSISEAYWDKMILVYEEELSQAPYTELSPCFFCITEKESNPAASDMSTAQGHSMDVPEPSI